VGGGEKKKRPVMWESKSPWGEGSPKIHKKGSKRGNHGYGKKTDAEKGNLGTQALEKRDSATIGKRKKREPSSGGKEGSTSLGKNEDLRDCWVDKCNSWKMIATAWNNGWEESKECFGSRRVT